MTSLPSASSLLPALPELFLSLGILAVLAVGLLRPAGSRQLPAALAVATAFFTILATVVTGEDTPRLLFDGLMMRDRFADFFKLLAPAAAVITGGLALFARDTFDFPGEDREAPEFYALLLTAVLGVQLMAAASDLLLAYLALELVSIMSYVLTGFSRGSRRSAEAALKYVVYGGVASGALLYGLSLLYGFSGSTSFVAVRAALASAPAPLALAAVALSLAGLGYKVAIVPFHQWCPDVYEGAPTPVAAFLSVAAKAGGFALLLRFFGAPTGAVAALGAAIPWSLLALVIAVASMTLGNLAALGQHNVKRLLAYSSIAHAGYAFLGLAVGAPGGHQAILFYLGTYLFINLGAFGVVVAVMTEAARAGTPAAAALDLRRGWVGLGRRAPALALAMTVLLFALAGLPPTAGFIGKYYLFSSVVAAGRATGDGSYFVAAIAAVANSVVSLAYYLRVMRAMYIEAPAVELPPARSSRALTTLLVGLAAVTLFLGVYWAPLDQLAAASVAPGAPAIAGR